jgi:regulatory protein
MQLDERNKYFASLWARATAALARREHSELELRKKLKLRDEFDLVDEVIAALLADDLVSNERFASMLCRSRFNRGVGPVRIEHELNQHQIRAEWIEAAMTEYEHRWIDQLQDIKARKYGDSPPADYKSWAKQARFFQQRGFTSAQIQQAIPR